jgi:nucleotide-binding universal stress UspA family protein
MRGYRKVLIAVNGSKDILKYGLKLARDEKCWVTIVKVIPQYEGDLELVGIKNIGDILNSNGQKFVSDLENAARAEKALVKVRLEEGDIAQKIVEVAEEERCDVIIMGGRERKGLKRFLVGSVTERGHAPCPVLVTRG